MGTYWALQSSQLASLGPSPPAHVKHRRLEAAFQVNVRYLCGHVWKPQHTQGQTMHWTDNVAFSWPGRSMHFVPSKHVLMKAHGGKV